MRASERLFVIGGVVLAIGLALAARVPGGGSAAWAVGAQPATPRIATVDVYSLVERLIARPEMATPLNDLAQALNDRVNAARQELETLQRELQGLAPTDPQAGARQQDFLVKREGLNQLFQQSSAELDKARAEQLIDAYKQAREAAGAVSGRLGYTLVIASRAPDAPIQQQAMALALQELLARPVLKSDPADDITKQVAEELKLGE